MVTEKQYLEAQKIVDVWNSQLNQSRVIPRYFVDIRVGCGAVRDKWHESYDEDYPGLHSNTPDVVEYKQGCITNGVWSMMDEDVKYLNDLCERLNLKAENKILKDINEKMMKALRTHDVVGQSEQLYDRCSCDKLFEQASKIDVDNDNDYWEFPL